MGAAASAAGKIERRSEGATAPRTVTSFATTNTVDQASFRDTIAFIQPKPSELRWQEIPWQTDIREACRLATEQGKPIFLWAMNGNPLGCT